MYGLEHTCTPEHKQYCSRDTIWLIEHVYDWEGEGMMHKHADLELIWWLLKGSRAAVGWPRSRSSHGRTPRREEKGKQERFQEHCCSLETWNLQRRVWIPSSICIREDEWGIVATPEGLVKSLSVWKPGLVWGRVSVLGHICSSCSFRLASYFLSLVLKRSTAPVFTFPCTIMRLGGHCNIYVVV